jgi:hypothetical protein
MRQQEVCYIEFCKSRVAEACVWHHHSNEYCNFNPFTDSEDEFHCMLKFCSKHAEEFKLVQKGDDVKRLNIQFKDKKQRRHF